MSKDSLICIITAYSFQCYVALIVFFLAVRSSLKLHSSTLAFELPLSICQWRTLDISFTKLSKLQSSYF